MAPQCSLVREIDFLVFPPKSFYLQVLSTQTTAGGWATLLIPLLMGAIFAVIWVQNDAIPDVSQSFSRDLKQLGALQLQIDCTTRDALGNANPFCPGRGAGSAAIPPPAGFQFVPTISDTACQHSIVRAANRSLSQTWLSESNAPESYSSPAIVAVETALGIPESSIAGAGDPFQLVRLATLAKDMSIVPQDLWVGAGAFFSRIATGTFLQHMDASATLEALKNTSALSLDEDYQSGSLRRTDLISEIELGTLGDPARDPLVMAAAAASSAPSTVVSSPRIPLCPFPNVAFSGALEASPPTSGLGVLVTLPPYFNWSSFLQASDSPVGSLVRYRIMPSASLPGSLIPTEGIPVTLVKGPSGLGGSPFSDTLQVWNWYAKTMSWSDSPPLVMPFISYDIDITRTVFVDGSVRLQAVATATVGKLQHGDAANYYGWGSMASQPIPHLAACGDVYAEGESDLAELFDIAKALGYEGDESDFVADGSWALADLLPAVAVDFSLGCGSAAASLQGWPRASCAAAQALRADWLEGDSPLLFNVAASASASSISARLGAVYARIHHQSDAFIHKSLLPRPIAKYARRDEALIQTKYGWQAARAHANSISTMMQAQHGCGFYCVDPIAFGVGSTSLIWDSPSTTQNEPSIRGSVRPNRSAVIYVQRARPAVVCDNASFPLPWKRADENEYFGGDNSLIYLSNGPSGWTTARLAAPVVAILLRTNSWTDVTWSSSRQSVLALLGATLGFTGTLFTVFLTIKQKWTYHIDDVLASLGHAGHTETAKVSPESSSTSATPSRINVAEAPVRQRWAAPAPHVLPPPEEEYYL